MNWIAHFWLLGALASQVSCGNEANCDEPVDIIKVVESLPDLVLLAATTDIVFFRCLTANLTGYDPSTGQANYTCHIQRRGGLPQQDLHFDYIINKEDPDKAVGFINFDTSHPIDVQALYTDYKSCAVQKVFLGSQEACLQWVAKGTENAVPEACNTAFNEKCGDRVLLYMDGACE